MTSASPPSARHHSRPPSTSPPGRSPSKSPSSSSRGHGAPQDHLETHLDWVYNKLPLFDTCRDTGDPIRLQVETPVPLAGALADTDHDDVCTLHTNADAVLRAFRKWLAPDGDGAADAEVSVDVMSHWPILGAGDQRQVSALTRLCKRVIPPFAAAVSAMEYDDDNTADPPATGISFNLRALLISLDHAASPGVTSAVQLALAVASIIKHDSQPEITIPGADLAGWIRALLFDLDPQATIIEERKDLMLRSVRVVSMLAVRVAIMLMSLAVYAGAPVDDLDLEFGQALESMCSEWGDVVNRLRELPVNKQDSAIRLPTVVASSLRCVVAEQILHMELNGGVRTSHTSTTSTASRMSSPHPLTISTSRTTKDAAGHVPTSRPETANTSSSGETTPKAFTHGQALASQDEQHDEQDGDEDDNGTYPDPGTRPFFDSLPTQQMQDMQAAMQIGWILGPAESQFQRFEDVRAYMPMPTVVHGSDSEEEQEHESDRDNDSDREPFVLAHVDELMDQRASEEDEDEDEEADADEADEHEPQMRDMGAIMGLGVQAGDGDAMDEDQEDADEHELVSTATRPKRARQDSSASNLDADILCNDSPDGFGKDGSHDNEHDSGDVDLARPLHKRRKVDGSPRFKVSEQTVNRRANGGRLIDTQPSPSHRSHASMQPPSFDDLTVRGDSTTGRLAMPPIPSPSRSRQRAATAAATCLMDIGRDDDNGGTANDRAEQPPAQIQQLDRRPPWTRQPHPHLPGARIASMPLSDSDTEPPAPRPGSPAQPAARPFGPLGPLRHPPPPPQPRLVPLPDPEQPQRGTAAAAAAAPAPAAGAAPRARPRRPRTAWTIEEEEALERAMEEFADCPTSWAEILRRHGQPGGPLARFDQVQLKDKARNIKTKRRKAGLPLGVFECATDYPNGL